MCGIFTVVSSPIMTALQREPAPLPELDESPEELKSSLMTLDFARFHQAYVEAEAAGRWRALAERLSGEVDSFSGGESEGGGALRLLRDVAWRIDHDLLHLLGAAAALLTDPDRRERGAPVWVAWQLELTLRALGRLEVRGRDSAGISILLWFEDAECRDELVQGRSSADGQVLYQAVEGTSCLVLTYRVAEEVGALGYNEGTLRRLIQEDPLFQEAVRAEPTQVLLHAHTRWASNGIISLQNAHPVDGRIDDPQSGEPVTVPGRSLAVLNGDVDNYVDVAKLIRKHGELPWGVTTDAKAIPVLAELDPAGDVDRAFADMMDRLEGSFATVLTRAERPGTIWCALKGTGQALYLATAPDVVVATSEVYGSAELTQSYWNVEAAREEKLDSVVLRIEATGGATRVRRVSGARPADLEPAMKSAEITTRDVDRRGFSHFFRKELEEAVGSVEKTIRGRYRRTSAQAAEPEVDFSELYGERSAELFQTIEEGKLRRIVFLGQGSACVAGKVGARFMAEAVEPAGIVATAMTAGDFSAHELRSDLSETWLVAISQSGTTTDTNRCLTLGKERGARVVGIVNRRNSAMVELCDAMIYTSDGRDVEMAVASTKAFYSQVAATFMLAQHVGLLTGGLVQAQVSAALADLERLPEVMRSAFALEGEIAQVAREVGLKRRHWSLLGSGPSVATAEEIRIKFSELCYKSVSVDYLENKKHIDLSAEPLILAALHDLRSDLVVDAVKEVSIFAAHRGITVVLCDRDADLYRSHTPFVFEVPPLSYGLGAVTTAVMGHLFAYHTAVAMDEVAQRLRHLRKTLLRSTQDPRLSGTHPLGFEASGEARLFLSELFRGDFDALWPAGTTSRLGAVLQLMAADLRTSINLGMLLMESDQGNATDDADEWSLGHLSTAIADATRPIDSIRHQAKTITVGTSRSGYSPASVLSRTLKELGIAVEDLPRPLQPPLSAIDDILADVPSGIRYEVHRGRGELRLQVARKIGLAAQARSRFDEGATLNGTKLASVRRRQPLVVRGIRDNARLLVFPILLGGRPTDVVLLHLGLRGDASEQQKRRFLEAFPQRAEQLVEHFEELLGRPVAIRELARFETEDLLFAAPTAMESARLET